MWFNILKKSKDVADLNNANGQINILPFFIIQFIINQTVLLVTSVPIRYMPELFQWLTTSVSQLCSLDSNPRSVRKN